jgi:hypothetical protein
MDPLVSNVSSIDSIQKYVSSRVIFPVFTLISLSLSLCCLHRRVDFCAKDSALQSADLRKLIPFKTFEECGSDTVAEIAKLLTIHFVHSLKSPVIVTPTFMDSVISFLKSQPKIPIRGSHDHLQPLDGDHIVECMSTLDTIRALCSPGLFQGLYTSVKMANYIILV